VPIVRAILKRGVVNTLVTDEATARALLERR
jgi:DNA-binding transcriptional regulator LsrR (DeoR family)